MKNPSLPLTTLLLATLACRPVITVGWQEIAIVGAIILILIGPPLFRLYRRVVEFQLWRKRKKDDE
jgi:hypothetical protein